MGLGEAPHATMVSALCLEAHSVHNRSRRLLSARGLEEACGQDSSRQPWVRLCQPDKMALLNS